jgi:hypothetical protein
VDNLASLPYIHPAPCLYTVRDRFLSGQPYVRFMLDFPGCLSLVLALAAAVLLPLCCGAFCACVMRRVCTPFGTAF